MSPYRFPEPLPPEETKRPKRRPIPWAPILVAAHVLSVFVVLYAALYMHSAHIADWSFEANIGVCCFLAATAFFHVAIRWFPA